MKWNGPNPWSPSRFRRPAFGFPSLARYNWLGRRFGAPSVAQRVAQLGGRFRLQGERRFMVVRRDNSSTEPPIRAELVARVRQEIHLGVYETAEKLEIALQRLLAELEEKE